MDNLKMFEKIAIEQARTQMKLRDSFIEDFINMNAKHFKTEKSIEGLKDVLKIAYNKGAADALAIMATAGMAMEGGEDYGI